MRYCCANYALLLIRHIVAYWNVIAALSTRYCRVIAALSSRYRRVINALSSRYRRVIVASLPHSAAHVSSQHL